MKKNIILKSVFRKPIIGILLTVLIGLVSYGFVGKSVETMIVWRETNRLEGYYRSIGYITKVGEGEEHSFSEGAALIEQSPPFAYGDLRRQTTGFMHDYYNTDFDTGTMDVPETLYAEASLWYGEGVYNLDYWFYGTLIDFEQVYSKKEPLFFGGNLLIFKVDQVLAGYPDRIQAGKKYVVWIPARFTAEFDRMAPYLHQMQEGQRYLLRAWSHPTFPFAVTGIDAVNWDSAFNLKPLDEEDLWFIPVAPNETIDLSLPQYKNLKLEIDRLNQNLRSIMLIGTSDMSAMPEVQLDSKNFFLVEGRWLNRDDEQQANPVIVISKNLAETRGIEVGDPITVTMRELKDPYHSYIRSEEDIENWSKYPSQTITYEVVGVYSNPSMETLYENENWFSNSYVPNSTIPDEFTFYDDWSTIQDNGFGYSFVLNNPRQQDAFIEEFMPKLNSLDFSLTFTDNNGKNFVAGADPLRKTTLIGVVLFTAALLMAITLSVFLYLRQQRRNYAILRALGVPANMSNKQLMLPLLVLGLMGSMIGSLLSWQNAHAKAAESLSKLPLPSGVLPELTLHPVFGVGFWLLVMLTLGVVAFLGSYRVTNTPVLELLQDNTRKKEATESDASSGELDFDRNWRITSVDTTFRGRRNPIFALTDYFASNTMRAPIKSLLTVVVAAAILLALGWFQTLIKANKEEITRLYQSSSVQIDFFSKQGDLVNKIPREGVEWVENSGFIDHSYLSYIVGIGSEFQEEGQTQRELTPYKILALNNLEYGLERALEYTVINFLPGYGSDSFSEKWLDADNEVLKLPLVIPEDIMLAEGWQLGQELVLGCRDLDEPVTFIIIGSSMFGKIGYSEIVDGQTSGPYRFLITNLLGLEKYFSKLPNYYEVAFYSAPDMNYRLKAFKSEVLEQQSQSTMFPVTIQFWDEELLAVVEPMEQNLSLMERLYPLTMSISGVIGGVLCLLLVLNQAKETALLRMLGVRKASIRMMQLGQIVLLSVPGLIIGFIFLIAFRGFDAVQWSVGLAALVYLVGALLGAFLGTILVAGRKPMELLQVKE